MVSCRKGAEGETYTSRYVLCDEDDYRSHDNDSAYPNILNVTHIYVCSETTLVTCIKMKMITFCAFWCAFMRYDTKIEKPW